MIEVLLIDFFENDKIANTRYCRMVILPNFGLEDVQTLSKHLLDNPDCAKLYNDDMFRSPVVLPSSSFGINIQMDKPPWCRQKEFVFSIGLQW